MTQEFTLNRINRQWLEWKTKRPSLGNSSLSPTFWFQGVEWCFELHYCLTEYAVYMRNESGQNVTHPFDVTSFVDVQSKKLVCAYKETISDKSTRIGYFHFRDTDLQSYQVLTFVFVFEGDIGMRLHLGKSTDPDTNPHTYPCLEHLSQDFRKLLDDGSYHDMEFRCQEDSFKAHKSVVSARSDVFSAMLESEMVEGKTGRIQIPDMDSSQFKQFLRYIYSGELPEMTLESARCYYEAADKFAIKGLMEPCADFLIKNLTQENACDMLILADAHNDQNFKQKVMAFVLENELPLQEDIWQAFCDCKPKLAVEVLNLSYTKQKKK